MTVAKIHGSEFPVRKIFSNDFNFAIPLYQRPYSWTTEQAGELIDDLLEFIGPDTSVDIDDLSPYFLGSIVLIKEEGQPDSEVVDGQQRLTTLNILMAALRHSIQEPTYSSAMTKYLYEEGDPIEGNPNRYRLTLRQRDAEFFRKHVQDADKITILTKLDAKQLTDSQRNIQANALLYMKRLEGLPDEQRVRLAQFIVKNCLMVVVSTPDLDSAYRIFSILNDRGLDLSHSDILKSEIIGRIPESQQDEYNENWEDAEEELGRDAFSDLFAHIRMIYRKQKGRESVLKEFREYVVKSVGDAKKLIDDVLIPYSDAFSIIQTCSYESTENAEHVNQLLKWLNRIDNTDWVSPAVLYLARNKANSKALSRFLKDLERLAAFLMICRYGINERMERYGKLLTAIENDADLYADESPLQLSDGECRQFARELDGDVYAQVPKRRLYILLRLDSELSDGSATYDLGVISIEHVLPQNPPSNSEWCEWYPTRELRESWVHRLGNLLLLSHRKNSSASNYNFEKKKAAYFLKGGVSPFPLTTQVVSEKEWSEQVVRRRQDDLLGKLKSVWRIDVATDTGPVDESEENDLDDGPADTPEENGDTGKSKRDYTKFDVTIGDTTYGAQSKRVAVFRVVKHLCKQGVTPEELAEVVPWRTTMFCSVDGIVSSSEFVIQMKSKVESGGKRRYFCEDGELIHSNGRTYAVTSGWGTKAFHAIQNIVKRFPDKGVSCEKQKKVPQGKRPPVTEVKWSDWQSAMSSVTNPAVTSYFNQEITANRDSYLARRILRYSIANRRRWFMAARKDNAYVWQRGRFEGDINFWKQGLSEPDAVKPVKDGECLRLLLNTAEDFQFFHNAAIKALHSAEWIARSPKGERVANSDFTRYDVTIDGQPQPNLAQRQAVFTIVRHLITKGHSPEEIAAAVPDWRRRMFRFAEGTLNSKDLIARQKNSQRSFRHRFFCRDEELIYHDKKTYAFYKQWGRFAADAIDQLIERFPGESISYRVSE